MKLKQKKLLLFLGGSAGAIALSTDIAIASPALTPHALRFLLSHSQTLLITITEKIPFLWGQLSFQVVRALMPLKTANLTLIQQIEHCTSEAVDDLVPLVSFTYEVKLDDSRGSNKDYKTEENQEYLTANFDYIAPYLEFRDLSANN